MRPIVDRSQDVRDATENRQAISARLSNYLDTLRGKCITHFAAWDTLADCASHFCDYEFPVADWTDYPGFKLAFEFERFTYCFHCGTPNDTQRHNYFQPAAHLNMRPSECAWKHLVFKTIFILWGRSDTLKAELFDAHGHGLNDITTLEEFAQWAVEDVRGNLSPNYYNGLSLFVSFCDWHASDDQAFGGMGFETI